ADYDFERDDFGRILFDGRTFATSGLNTRFHLSYDPKEGRLEDRLFEIGLSLPGASLPWPTGGSVGVRYRYLRDIPRFFESFAGNPDRFEDFEEGFDHVHQIDPRLRVNFGTRWALKYNASYSFQETLLLRQGGTLQYISKCRCWGAQLQVGEGRTRGVQFTFAFTILGLGDDSANPFSGTAFQSSLLAP
ncbi:MAG: hypothetical protein V3T33_07170, partial [Myxococcota bacterium]